MPGGDCWWIADDAIDDCSRYVDFRALHHTAGTFLAAGGVHPKVAQKRMRHSDINLTMSRYHPRLGGPGGRGVGGATGFGSGVGEQGARGTGTADWRNRICS